jgi:protein-disulfide isomerase
MAKKKSTATRRAESVAASARAAEIRRAQERKERRRQTLVVTAVGVVVLALIVLVVTLTSSSRDDSGAAASAPKGVVAGYAVPSGRATAPVKVTVYEDFMCPFCGQFEAASRSAFQEDIDQGRVQFQYQVLNFLDDRSSSDYSTRAANALAVVLDTSGPPVAKRFHDLVFENQPEEGSAGLSDDRLVELAVQAGAQQSRVRPGIEDLEFEQWVDNVTDRSSKDGVNATPTVRIDGRTVESESIDGLVTSIEKAIAAGGS